MHDSNAMKISPQVGGNSEPLIFSVPWRLQKCSAIYWGYWKWTQRQETEGGWGM